MPPVAGNGPGIRDLPSEVYSLRTQKITTEKKKRKRTKSFALTGPSKPVRESTSHASWYPDYHAVPRGRVDMFVNTIRDLQGNNGRWKYLAKL